MPNHHHRSPGKQQGQVLRVPVVVIIQVEPSMVPYWSTTMGTIQAQHRTMATVSASLIGRRSRRSSRSIAVSASTWSAENGT